MKIWVDDMRLAPGWEQGINEYAWVRSVNEAKNAIEYFEKWFDENYYEIEGETMNLEKDILVKGNRIYSPNTCVFAPRTINSLFLKNNIKRGELPIGVNMIGNKYEAHMTRKNKSYHIAMSDTIEGAFNAYKEAKEKEIKRVADEYKGKIPQKLYDAMYSYQVEITD